MSTTPPKSRVGIGKSRKLSVESERIETMGRRQESITITAQLSSHNDEQDDIDEARWEDRYVDINPMIV